MYLEVSGDKRVGGEGTSSDLGGKDKRIFCLVVRHSDETKSKEVLSYFQFTQMTINENESAKRQKTLSHQIPARPSPKQKKC